MQQDIQELIYKIKLDKDFKILVHDYQNEVGYIKPILYSDLDNDNLIEKLKTWRNSNISAYLDQTPATFEGTRRWLENNVLNNKSKILFLVYTHQNQPIGHIGLADGLSTESLVEIDNIVRGVKVGQKGSTSLALFELISWVFLFTSTSRVYLRVFSDNHRAISVYENLRFTHKDKQPLRKSIDEGIIKYEFLKSDESSDLYFSYMELERNDHFNNYENLKNF